MPESHFQTLPCGTWPSPISAEKVAAGGVGLEGARPVSGGLIWSEVRALEGGRVVLVYRNAQGHTRDVLPEPFSSRTRVHEYGGGAWWAGRNTVYFCNYADQRIYRFRPDDSTTPPQPITPEPPLPAGYRFADGTATRDGQWIIAVREDHTAEGQAINTLVVLPTDGSMPPRVLIEGADFYAAPRLSPDGQWLSFIRWNHPNMPWDSSELCRVSIDWQFNGQTVEIIAGGGQVSVQGADWDRLSRLIYSSDERGFWNLYRHDPARDQNEALTHLDGEEIGAPAWVFGMQRWCELSDGTLLAIATCDAQDRLVRVEHDGTLTTLEARHGSLAGLSADSTRTLLLAHGATTLPTLLTLNERLEQEIIRPPEALPCEVDWISRPEAIEFDVNGDHLAHAFYYPPRGAGLEVGDQERPPLIVIGHGGPTAHTSPALNLKIQYWTSRGFAVADVNYSGSTGYGRAYRERLRDRWGLIDVEDCIAAAKQLADSGRVDPNRMAIRGGSAGGFTVLRALTTSTVFSAGVSLYGVADLTALAADTHKFESRYLDGLIGPWPEARDVYIERSPINHIQNLSCPILVLQGLEDEVVPPNQAEAIIAAARGNDLPHAWIYFEGEQHGFRQAENIVRALEAELWFYGRVFGFEPATAIAPLSNAFGLN